MTAADWVDASVQLLDGSIQIGAFIYPVLWGMAIVRKIFRGSL